MKSNFWTRNELLMAISLYCQIPFGKIHNRNPDIIAFANQIGRTPSSVSYKLANFAYLDSNLKQKGASHVSKLDKIVWEEFQNNWSSMVLEAETLRLLQINAAEDLPTHPKGEEKIRLIKTRVNQSFFRASVLSNYDHSCCITGVSIPQLLVASHIVPWSVDESIRLNPKNGLCLNPLHDKAFDLGLITLNQNLQLVISSRILKVADNSFGSRPEHLVCSRSRICSETTV